MALELGRGIMGQAAQIKEVCICVEEPLMRFLLPHERFGRTSIMSSVAISRNPMMEEVFLGIAGSMGPPVHCPEHMIWKKCHKVVLGGYISE